jgi:lipoprotein-releasing system permease protein
MIGLAIGVAALILTLSAMRGFETEVEKKVAGIDGHLRLTSALGEESALPDSILLRLQKHPEIEQVTPFIASHALIRNRDRSDGIYLLGADLQQLREVMNVERLITAGSFPVAEDSASLILGDKLAQTLNVQVGDRVFAFDITYLLGHQGIRGTELRVAAIYRSGMVEYDQLLGFTSLETALSLFGRETVPPTIILNLYNHKHADELAQRIEDDLGFPYYLMSWRQRHANLFSWLKGQQLPILIVFGFIALVALINIFSTLSLIVVEKQKDIGILRSLGFSKQKIRRIFLIQGGLIGFIGSFTGIILALLLGFLQQKFQIVSLESDIYFMDAMPIQWTWQGLMLIPLFAWAMSLLAAMWPARRAAIVQPAEALRYE